MKRRHRGFITFFFLFLSLCILALTGYGIARVGYHGIERVFFFLQDEVKPKREYISSYLSHMTRFKIAHDALMTLESEKRSLAEVQRELDELEMSMEAFLKTIEEKQEVYEANVSSFDFKRLIKDLRAWVHLDRSNTLFNRELTRRKNLFFESYESKRTRLLNSKHLHEKRIVELSHFIEGVQRKGAGGSLYTDELPFIKETQRLHIERTIFFIEHEEYRRAAEALKTLMETGFDDQGLLIRLLTTLDELERRRNQVTIEDLFSDLKLSYLSEDYEKALDQVEGLNTDPFIRPLLGGLSTALHRNIEITREIDEEINLRKDVKSLIGMASRLEKIGEYEKAVELYRKLLLLDLPPHDREHLTGMLYSAMELSMGSELKRRDNTQAIKILEDARRLVLEGKKDEAFKHYILLIKECPHSDYIEKAVGEIIRLRG